MHGRIKSETVELTIVVTSDDFGYTKSDAIADANEHFAENYPGEVWERVDVELDKYNAWSVRYCRKESKPNDKRADGPDWAWSEYGRQELGRAREANDTQPDPRFAGEKIPY